MYLEAVWVSGRHVRLEARGLNCRMPQPICASVFSLQHEDMNATDGTRGFI